VASGKSCALNLINALACTFFTEISLSAQVVVVAKRAFIFWRIGAEAFVWVTGTNVVTRAQSFTHDNFEADTLSGLAI